MSSDSRFDNFSKTGLVTVIKSLESQQSRLMARVDESAARINAFTSANVLVRVYRALRGRIS